jgi:putative ABC transport system permease protein
VAYRRPHCCDWAGCSQDSDGEADNWTLFSWEAFKLFRANTSGFRDLAALQVGNIPLAVRPPGASGPADGANGQFVSGNFFQTFRPWAFPLGTSRSFVRDANDFADS